MRENKNLGLVMSGGGTRGAYQMGVWQALHETRLDKQIKVVTGASIGAINGALVAQQDWDLALELWQNIKPQQIFDGIESGFNYKELMRDWYQHGGIRVNGLKALLKEHLDEQTIRQSPIDFGLVVYNKTLRKGQSLFPEAIPEGLLIEYIIASATFPIFEAHRIGDYEYIDGGIYSILPTKIAFDRQHLDLVIAIDVAEASRFSPQQWIWHRQYAERLIYIRPSKILPSPMNFSKEAFEKQLELGYRDGLKKLANFTEMAIQ
ncbi:MAG: patatin-like phospholipase family protein [Saprospiraceae bacterium]|nr:patatin-like phospholipase family protein [Saprospiraceae bacterium]